MSIRDLLRRQADRKPTLVGDQVIANVDMVFSDLHRTEGERCVPITWRELAEQRAAELRHLQPLATFVRDLTRCPHGRCAGDACSGWRPERPTAGCEGGRSLGNPQTPLMVGYDISGQPYRVEHLADWRSMASNAADVEGVDPAPIITVGGKPYYPPSDGPRPL